MAACVLWSAVVWTVRGLLCTWRFFWVSPYDAVSAAQWTQSAADTVHKASSQQSPDDKNHTKAGVNSARCVQHERSGTLHRRLLNAEGEIQQLKREIYNQRASWEMRFVELQRRQHDLREQLTSEILVRSAMLYREADSEDANEVFTESGLENGHADEKQQRSSVALRHVHLQKASEMGTLGEDAERSCGGQSSCSSFLDTSNEASVRSWMSGGGRPRRVFVPHSPLDLKMGHRVRVMLPSGRISTGTLRYLGRMQNSSDGDYHLGVELELPDNGQRDGTYEGKRYFTCEAGHGAFVGFSKLLMAWE